MKNPLYTMVYSAPPSVLRRGRGEKAADGQPNRVHPSSSLHMLRDGHPLLNLYSILANDYFLAGEILNLPPDVFAVPSERNPGGFEAWGSPGDIPKMGRGSLILQATRFPLNDDPKNDKSSVWASGSRLEGAIAETGRRYFFSYCSRHAIILNDLAAGCCPNDKRIFRAVQFAEKSDDRTNTLSGFALGSGDISDVRHLNRCTALPRGSMLGYLTFVPKLGACPAAFLNVFGSSGTGTLIFSRIVRETYSERVLDIVRAREPRLLVCLFQPRFAEGAACALAAPPEVLIDVAVGSG